MIWLTVGFSGASLGWSEVVFSEPIAAVNDGFYVVFRLPLGSVHTADGIGGGAGIGYTEGPNGFTGWFSLDGEEPPVATRTYRTITTRRPRTRAPSRNRTR